MGINTLIKKCHNHIHTQLNSTNTHIGITRTKDESLKHEITSEIIPHNNCDNAFDYDDSAKDLMYMVGNSIEEWAKKYGMENLPKKVIFRQALSIMNSIQKIWFD